MYIVSLLLHIDIATIDILEYTSRNISWDMEKAGRRGGPSGLRTQMIHTLARNFCETDFYKCRRASSKCRTNSTTCQIFANITFELWGYLLIFFATFSYLLILLFLPYTQSYK